MIAADREVVIAQLKQSAAELRMRELNFYTNNFQALGTTAALLAGFAFTGVSSGFDTMPQRTVDPKTGELVLFQFEIGFIYSVFCCLAMVCNLSCVCMCTFVYIVGPGTSTAFSKFPYTPNMHCEICLLTAISRPGAARTCWFDEGSCR